MNRIFFLLIVPFFFNGCSTRDINTLDTRRIIFFGDSITELGIKPNGYVTIIRDSLEAMGYRYNVIGAGISGNKVTDLLARIEKDVLSKRPSVVVLYIGINDVWHFEFASRGLTGTSKETFKSGLMALISEIQSIGSKVILCTPSVIGEKNNGSNKYDVMLNDYSMISRRVAKKSNISLCDLRQTFLERLKTQNPSNAEKDIFTVDGVHLNDEGNRLVATTILRTLDGLGLFFPQR